MRSSETTMVTQMVVGFVDRQKHMCHWPSRISKSRLFPLSLSSEQG